MRINIYILSVYIMSDHSIEIKEIKNNLVIIKQKIIELKRSGLRYLPGKFNMDIFWDYKDRLETVDREIAENEQIIIELEFKKSELEEKDKEILLKWIDTLSRASHKLVIKYDNIEFNLSDETLDIGTLSSFNGKQIRHISKHSIDVPNLWNKTPKAVMLLYCIIKDIIENNNFEIKDKFLDYSGYISIYKTQLWITDKRLPAKIGDYVSSLNSLLKNSSSWYEITKKRWGNPQIFQKISTNKSS